MRRLFCSAPAFVFAGFVGLAFGACKDGGTSSPGSVTSVQGAPACPRSVPRSGASCPRGQVDFCVYRTTGSDYVCTCGKSWTCSAK